MARRFVDDKARLAALAAYNILDTPPEQGFDEIVGLARQICGTATALVSIVERDRQWFKAREGFDPPETPIEQSVCAHALGESELLVIPDLTKDPRTSENTLVLQEPHIRFYAGAPLVTPSGHIIGTLCVIDPVPRPEGLTDAQAQSLRVLANQVVALMEMRRALAVVADAQRTVLDDRRRFVEMFDQAPSFMAMLRGPSHVYEMANPAYMKLIGHRDIVGKTVAEALPEAASQGYVDILDKVYQTGVPYASTGALYAFQPTPESPATERYVDFIYQPLRGPDGTVEAIFVEGADVSDRVGQLKRQGALADLGERLRDLDDVGAIVAAAANSVAQALGACRSGFGTVDAENETMFVQSEVCAPGIGSIAGTHDFRVFGSYVEELKRGETVVIRDVGDDARTRDNLAVFEAIQIRALLNIPVLQQGKLVLVLFIHDDEPRDWTDEELLFLRQIGDRTQAAIAQTNALAQQRVLNQELSHRLKNTLAMVQAIATQTLRGVSERDAVDALIKRIHALSTAHNVLLQQSWSAARILEVTEAVLSAFDRQSCFELSGPNITFGPRAALSLSLLLHELGTNALKYGSLSVPDGRVNLSWRVDIIDEGASELVMTWRESGGPPPAEPTGRGFGSRLIRMGLLGNGGVELAYPPHGFCAVMRAPLNQLQHA